jgi:hypothetical protein
MVHFIVPLRSPKVAKDWTKTKKLCKGAISSIEQQTSKEYSIQLVCHTAPEGFGSFKNINIVEVDFKVPSTKREMMEDKIKKVKRGSHDAQKEIGDYVMVLDADDRISNELVEYVVGEGADVLYIERGYVWPHGRRFCFKWSKFNRLCGSSNLVRYNGNNMPSSISGDGRYLVCQPHGEVRESAEKRGLRVKKIPFAAACYITDTEDNHSGISFVDYMHKKRFLKKVIGFRPLTSSIRSTFAISNELS